MQAYTLTDPGGEVEPVAYAYDEQIKMKNNKIKEQRHLRGMACKGYQDCPDRFH